MVNEQIVNEFMAYVKWNSAINYVKGALTKPKKEDGHTHGDYLIGTHREAATTNPNCTRVYVKGADAYKRGTPVTADELAQRLRFKTVSRAVAARAKSLQSVQEDRVNFNAQKDDPNGKKTMKSYLWSLELESYDSSH